MKFFLAILLGFWSWGLVVSYFKDKPDGWKMVTKWDDNTRHAYNTVKGEITQFICEDGFTLLLLESKVVSGTLYRFKLLWNPDRCEDRGLNMLTQYYGTNKDSIRGKLKALLEKECEVTVWMKIVSKNMVITNDTCQKIFFSIFGTPQTNQQPESSNPKNEES